MQATREVEKMSLVVDREQSFRSISKRECTLVLERRTDRRGHGGERESRRVDLHPRLGNSKFATDRDLPDDAMIGCDTFCGAQYA